MIGCGVHARATVPGTAKPDRPSPRRKRRCALRLRAIGVVCLLTWLLLSPAPSSAAEPDPLAWHPEWSRFTAADWVFSGVLASSLLAVTLASNTPKENFRGGVLFDEPIRNALRIDSAAGRLSAGHVSDVFQAVLIVYPLI